MESRIPCLRKRSSAQTASTFGAFAGPPNFFEDGLTIANMMELGILQRILSVEFFSTHGHPSDICSSKFADYGGASCYLNANDCETRPLL